ncbi:MAG: sensor histidine kinase, partial [Turicibacter sanguinis]
LKTAIESKNLTVEYEPCDITMTSNQIMLTHAFSNLIQNAIKYNHDKGSIAIRTSVEEQSLIVEVIDTGIGIPKEQSEHIFNAFYCVDPSRSRKFGGAGLGLAITKDVIERHQGTIEYLPNSDGGSIFKVILPI